MTFLLVDFRNRDTMHSGKEGKQEKEKKMLMKVIFVVMLVCMAPCSFAVASEIAYDNGIMCVSYIDIGTDNFYANRFTNDDVFPVEVEAVLVQNGNPGGPSIVDVYLWEDDSGLPGSVLAGPVSGNMSHDCGWLRIDVSGYDLTLQPGSDIFAGFGGFGSTAWPAYDTEIPGVGRSWWDEQGDGSWVLGDPCGNESNFMVRLEVIPEPASASLLLLGAVVLLRRRRRP